MAVPKLSGSGDDEPFPVPLPNAPVLARYRCPFLYRSIVKRHAMTGSGLGRYAERGQPSGLCGTNEGQGRKVVYRENSRPYFFRKILTDFFQKNFREKFGNKNFSQPHQTKTPPCSAWSRSGAFLQVQHDLNDISSHRSGSTTPFIKMIIIPAPVQKEVRFDR